MRAFYTPIFRTAGQGSGGNASVEALDIPLMFIISII